MALRDQPYLPLYVRDFLSDEKLRECSAESIGVYIYIMCLMHRSDEYGKITLKDKDICRGKTAGKQTGKTSGGCRNFVSDFARKISRQVSFSSEIIERSLYELIEENVLFIDGKSLCQKRMIKDNDISVKRSLSGRKGATTTNKIFDKNVKENIQEEGEDFAAAKSPANLAIANAIVYIPNNKENIDKENKGIVKGKNEPEIIEAAEVDLFEDFQRWILENAPAVAKMKEPFTRAEYERLFDEYEAEDIFSTLRAMHNYKPLQQKSVSANLTVRNWLRRDRIQRKGEPRSQESRKSKLNQNAEALADALKNL